MCSTAVLKSVKYFDKMGTEENAKISEKLVKALPYHYYYPTYYS